MQEHQNKNKTTKPQTIFQNIKIRQKSLTWSIHIFYKVHTTNS